MDKTTISTHFTLSGDDFDIEYVSEALAILPNYTRSKDEVLKNGRKFGHTEWGIETEYDISLDVEEQFEKVYSIISEKVEILERLRVECNAEWSILFVIKIENGETPAMHLSKKIVKFAATIDAEIDFDVYVLSALE